MNIHEKPNSSNLRDVGRPRTEFTSISVSVDVFCLVVSVTERLQKIMGPSRKISRSDVVAAAMKIMSSAIDEQEGVS